MVYAAAMASAKRQRLDGLASPVRRTPIELPTPIPTSRRTRRWRLDYVIWIVAFAILVGGAWLSYDAWRVNRVVEQQAEKLAETPSGSESNNVPVPDEASPPSDYLQSYRVAADLPRVLRIPGLNVEARVMRVGVKLNNELIAPASIYDAGWYESSSRPGDVGAVLIDGHVAGPTMPGVFAKLANLRPGDTLSVETGAGRAYTYKVIKLQSYTADRVDMAAALAPVTPAKPGLNLITCAGQPDARTHLYDRRLVVFTEQVN